MTKALTLGVLAAFLFAGSLAACSDVGEPNDVINAQENSRLDRGMPSPTELPPGLGPDLASSDTQPSASAPGR